MAFSLTIDTADLDNPILCSLTTTGSASALHRPGYKTNCADGRTFMYVYNDSSGIAAVAGAPAAWFITTTDTAKGLGYACVTPDLSDGGLCSVGAFLSILAETYYGWIQNRGLLVDAPVSDGAGAEIAASDAVGATTDLLWTKITVGGTTETGGVALMAGSSGYANIHLLPA